MRKPGTRTGKPRTGGLNCSPSATRIPGMRKIKAGPSLMFSSKALLISAIAGSAAIISAFLSRGGVIEGPTGNLITLAGISIAFILLFADAFRRFGK